MSNGEAQGSRSQAPARTEVEALPDTAALVSPAQLRSGAYRFTYTTGPFALPANAQTIDWVLLNNDTTTQTVRVTVFGCPIGAVKTVEPPGALDIAIGPGETTHNANAASGGFIYEIQVETNSRRVFPYANAWPGLGSDPLPGSVVKAAEFLRRLP
jgi:hypothetical protein